MKWTLVALSLSLATAGPLAFAQPHRHQHRHEHRHAEKRTPGTRTVYELNGTPVPEDVVQKGLRDGSLVIVHGSLQSKSSTTQSTMTATPTPTVTSSVSVDVPKSTSMTTATSSSSSSSSSRTTASASAVTDSHQKQQPSNKISTSDQSSTGVDRDFPDGQIDCSHFPSDYGAVPIPWTDLGGWTGLQKVTYTADGHAISDITTMKIGPCGDGMMCSYACPTGYQKGQWPKAQGLTKQSVGGIECKNGKLYLPGGADSKKLCIAGVGGVKVHNTIGKPIAVCRTDYPGTNVSPPPPPSPFQLTLTCVGFSSSSTSAGTESMTIPATLDIASTDPYELTCPDEKQYYIWDGKTTSAQYYVNPAGTSLENACRWGEAGSDMGNWAPLVSEPKADRPMRI